MAYRRFTREELRHKALAVIEDATDRGCDGPVEKTAGIAFALAWLANGTEDRSCFDEYWQELEQTHRWRSASLTKLTNGIYRALGISREVGRMHQRWGQGYEAPIGSVVQGREANRDWDQQH